MTLRTECGPHLLQKALLILTQVESCIVSGACWALSTYHIIASDYFLYSCQTPNTGLWVPQRQLYVLLPLQSSSTQCSAWQTFTNVCWVKSLFKYYYLICDLLFEIKCHIYYSEMLRTVTGTIEFMWFRLEVKSWLSHWLKHSMWILLTCFFFAVVSRLKSSLGVVQCLFSP